MFSLRRSDIPVLLVGALLVVLLVTMFAQKTYAAVDYQKMLDACQGSGLSPGVSQCPALGAAGKAAWDRLAPTIQDARYKLVTDFKNVDPKDPEAGKKLAKIANDYQAAHPRNSSCWNVLMPWTIATCIWHTVVAFFASIPVSIGIGLTTLTGTLFNWVIDYTIIQFASKVYSVMEPGINIAWTAFRDLANILLIGMFTFIALSMILGIERFGAKKFVARVLIVAVLINFSLLFTKIIIDTSNFVAKVFYDASGIQTTTAGSGLPGTAPGTSGTATVSGLGISGRYLNAMGIMDFSIGGSQNLLFRLAQSENGSWWLALFWGFLLGIMLLLLAGVFLYAAVLIIARTIILMFLMMVSALAFASYLIPAFAEPGAPYGWHKWWDSLLKNAIFAPLLLMFLWATLRVAEAFSGPAGGGIAALISNPAQTSNVQVLFNYMLILGLLFGSIKLASSFSSGMGTSLARTVTGGAASLGFGAAALAGRFSLGAAGLGLTPRMGRQTPTGRTNPDGTPEMMEEGGWWRRPTRSAFTRVAQGSFDVRKIPGVVAGTQMLGVNVGKAGGAGGYVQSIEDRKKEIAEREANIAKVLSAKGGAVTSTAPSEIKKLGEEIQGHNKEREDVVAGAIKKLVDARIEPPPALAPKAAATATPAPAQPAAASAKAESALSEQRHRVDEAQKEAQRAAMSRLAQDLETQNPILAKELRDAGEKLAKLDTTIREKDTKLAGFEKFMASPPLSQGQAYAASLSSIPRLSFFGSTAYSPGIAADVARNVGMSQDERLLRNLLKGVKSAETAAGEAKSAADKASRTATEAAARAAPKP